MSSESIERFYFIDYGEEPFVRESDHLRIVRELEAKEDPVAEEAFADWQQRLWAISGKVPASPDLGMESALQFVERRVNELVAQPSLSDATKEVEKMRAEYNVLRGRAWGEGEPTASEAEGKFGAADDILSRLKSLGPQRED